MTTDVQSRASSSARSANSDALAPTDLFLPRHIGPRDEEIADMLATLGLPSLDELIDKTVPGSIRLPQPLHVHDPRGEQETLAELRAIAAKNKVFRSFIGQGY